MLLDDSCSPLGSMMEIGIAGVGGEAEGKTEGTTCRVHAVSRAAVDRGNVSAKRDIDIREMSIAAKDGDGKDDGWEGINCKSL